MTRLRIEIGVVVTVLLAIASGLIWLGTLQGTVNALNPQAIIKARDDAITEIRKERETGASDMLSKHFKSAIVAFASQECPSGWEPYDKASGRVLLGGGTGNGLLPRTVGEQGGHEKIQLPPEALPPHQHWYIDTSVSAHGGGWLKGGGEGNNNETRKQTESTGEGKPFEIMPPYVVVTFCKRCPLGKRCEAQGG